MRLVLVPQFGVINPGHTRLAIQLAGFRGLRFTRSTDAEADARDSRNGEMEAWRLPFDLAGSAGAINALLWLRGL